MKHRRILTVSLRITEAEETSSTKWQSLGKAALTPGKPYPAKMTHIPFSQPLSTVGGR